MKTPQFLELQKITSALFKSIGPIIHLYCNISPHINLILVLLKAYLKCRYYYHAKITWPVRAVWGMGVLQPPPPPPPTLIFSFKFSLKKLLHAGPQEGQQFNILKKNAKIQALFKGLMLHLLPTPPPSLSHSHNACLNFIYRLH